MRKSYKSSKKKSGSSCKDPKTTEGFDASKRMMPKAKTVD